MVNTPFASLRRILFGFSEVDISTSEIGLPDSSSTTTPVIQYVLAGLFCAAALKTNWVNMTRNTLRIDSNFAKFVQTSLRKLCYVTY